MAHVTEATNTFIQRPHGRLIRFLLIVDAIFVAGISLWHYLSLGDPDYNPKLFQIAVFMGIVAIFGTIFFLAYQLAKARTKFWQEFAAYRNWTYEASLNAKPFTGVMFASGRGIHSKRIVNVVSGTDEGRSARIYEYTFSIGHGKHSTSYAYTVFEFSFAGAFPHLYLDCKKDFFSVRPKGELMLPEPYKEHFRFYAPEQYEIEALAIVDPSLLEFLTNESWIHDLELIDGRLLVFTQGLIGTLAQLEERYAKAKALALRLAPTLDHSRLAPIGDNPTTLSVGLSF